MLGADELVDLGNHTWAIQMALDDGNHSPLRYQVKKPDPKTFTLRVRLAHLLLKAAVCVAPEGEPRRMLRHLVAFWQEKWFLQIPARGRLNEVR